MPNKSSSKKWSDVEIAIATVSIAVTLGLWNVFAAPQQKNGTPQVNATVAPPPTDVPVTLSLPTVMPEVKILLGGKAPQIQAPAQVQASAPTTPRKHRSSGGSGSAGGTVTTTHSS